MKTKIFTVIAIMFLLPLISSGAYIERHPQKIRQPDGMIIDCFVSGDEYYNWLHSDDNYTIIQHPGTGYYVYADILNDSLIPTEFIVGVSDPKLCALKKGCNISAKKRLLLREAFLKKEAGFCKQVFKKEKSDKPLSIGNIDNIVVFVRFSDESEIDQDFSVYEDLFNSKTSASMKDYYNVVSYNKLNINSYFYPSPLNNKVNSFQDIHPRGYYLAYNEETNPAGYKNRNEDGYDRERELLINISEFLSKVVSSELNVDNDNDGYVDNICLIISQGLYDSWGGVLWPHKSLAGAGNGNLINGKRKYSHNLLYTNTDVKTLVHEMFHTLGAPDLYHYYSSGYPTGTWDIMGGGYGQMCAYMKFKYGGWIDSIPEVENGERYTLNLLTSPTNNCYKIKTNNSDFEYFVVEYRERSGYDGWVPGSGMIIYRINTNFNGNAYGPPDEVYVYRPGGTLLENGSLMDAPFSDQYERTKFNNFSSPNCFLTDGRMGYIGISNITEDLINKTISFTVDMLPDATITPAKSVNLCQGNSVLLKGVSKDGYSYKWLKNDTVIVGATKSDYLVSEAGVYRVEVTDVNNYSNISEKVTVTVNPLPIINIPDEYSLNLYDSLVIDAGSEYKEYFWSTGETAGKITLKGEELGVGLHTLTLRVLNDKDCEASVDIKISVIDSSTISGYISYDNFKNSPLVKVKVYLMDKEGNIVQSTSSDEAGAYKFEGVKKGQYILEASSAEGAGGYDPIDALMVNKYFLKLYKFNSKFKLSAGDVDLKNGVTPIDALMILRRYLKILKAFPAGSWVFESANINVDAKNLFANLKGLCYGDVNADYYGNKRVQNLPLNTKGFLNRGESSIIDLPVKVEGDLSLSSFGLVLKYDKNYCEILGISSNIKGLSYNILDNELRIGWYAIEENLSLNDGEELFNVRLKLNESEKSDNIIFSISGESLMADDELEYLDLNRLYAPKLSAPKGALLISAAPNPFKEETIVNYTIKEKSRVSAKLIDICGSLIEYFDEVEKTPGQYELSIANLKNPGVYFFEIKVNDYHKILKLMRMK
ncbi:MAG: M6 family metalloprotease domain-containing protein [Bacteroidales bacterium]|nr:M6 family metalloprotease domain-containing protein [Bacteroidales bacterium]